MKRRCHVLCGLAVTGVFFSPLIYAKPPLPGIYSDLRWNAEGGDLLGSELLIYPAAGNSWSAFVQIAEGAAPQTWVVALQLTKKGFEFTIPAGGAYGGHRFTGVFQGTNILLKWDSGVSETLKRGRSHWQ